MSNKTPPPRQYKDVAGNPCSLNWLVRNEPEWAVNQILDRDKKEAELAAMTAERDAKDAKLKEENLLNIRVSYQLIAVQIALEDREGAFMCPRVTKQHPYWSEALGLVNQLKAKYDTVNGATLELARERDQLRSRLTALTQATQELIKRWRIPSQFSIEQFDEAAEALESLLRAALTAPQSASATEEGK